MKAVKLLVAALTLAVGTAFAAEEGKKAPSPAQQAQQERMKSCNVEAKEKALKGDERKQFMSGCLSSKAPATQQGKMKSCNAEATEKQLKGPERKQFMSECLKVGK